MVFLTLLGAIVAGLMAFFRPFAGLLLTFAVSQVDFFVDLPAGLTVGRIIGLCAALGWFFQVQRRRRARGSGAATIKLPRLRLSPVVFPFLGVALFGIVLRSPVWGSLLEFIKLALLIVLSLMVEDLVRDRKRLRKLLLVVTIAYALLAVVPLGAYLGINVPGLDAAKFSGAADDLRYAGVTNNPNELGQLLNTAIVMGMALVFGSRKVLRSLPLLAAIAMAAMGIMLSVSRTHVIGMAAFFGLVAVLRPFGPQRGLKQFVGVAILCSGLAAIVAMNTPDYAYQRLRVFGPGVEVRTQNRMEFTTLQRQKALDLLLGHPFLGVGLHAFHQYRRGDVTDGMDAHDTISAVVGETGLLGAAALLFIIGSTGVSLYRGMRVGASRGDMELYYISLVLLSGLGAMCTASLGGMLLFMQRQFWLVVGFGAFVAREVRVGSVRARQARPSLVRSGVLDRRGPSPVVGRVP